MENILKIGVIPKTPNSQDCRNYGRKLSCVDTSDIAVSEGYIVIGSPNDDQIYYSQSETFLTTGDMLKERVKIFCINEPEVGDGWCFSIDLEDVLRFAAKNCYGIFSKISAETENCDL